MKLIKALIPSHLHPFIFKEDAQRQDETHQYEQTVQAHFVQQGDFPVLVSSKVGKQDRKYLAMWETLTLREQEVLALACMGHKNFEIAKLLGIGDATIKTHLQAIFRKFSRRDRHEIRLALRDLDFERWWPDRQRIPRIFPPTSTDR